ncbi:MAG: LEA type 2 family protein [Methanoregulaceae archaeon]|jgi:LEA14-like dessication related protein|nr:LEA type 2 family protein [Methanoregulaceae archaeon]
MQGYLALLCLMMAVALLFGGCGMLIKDPKVEVKNVALESVDLSNVDLLVTLSIENPNPIGITLKSISFDVYYQKGDEWVFISHGERGSFDIKPGMNEVTVPVSIKTSAIPGAVVGALAKGEITLRIKGTASPDFFGISPEVPFSTTTTIPLKL